jgi:proteic killer suppression protein
LRGTEGAANLAIQSFGDKASETFFFHGDLPKKAGWRALSTIAARKLDMLHYAARLDDLRVPPANRLEKLHGDLKGFHSIRINDQWRIIFKWHPSGPTHVKIVDYHK